MDDGSQMAQAHAAGVAEERARWEALLQEHIENMENAEGEFRAAGDSEHRRQAHQILAELKILRAAEATP